uniref:Uncharacterized protein n=1 Tax=Octopus bimaculoides TaxID=37653 RepID=A0A0L8I9G9_OCTBM
MNGLHKQGNVVVEYLKSSISCKYQHLQIHPTNASKRKSHPNMKESKNSTKNKRDCKWE